MPTLTTPLAFGGESMPWLEVPDRNVAPLGRVSEKTTFVAFDGPLFLTVNAYDWPTPAWAVGFGLRAVKERSAWAVAVTARDRANSDVLPDASVAVAERNCRGATTVPS